MKLSVVRCPLFLFLPRQHFNSEEEGREINSGQRTTGGGQLIEQSVVVSNRLGLHARAAAKLVRAAGAFRSRVRIERSDGGGSADAKSILSVLMLAASRGTELTVSAEGPDAAQAVDAVCALFAEKFGEE